MTPTTPIRSSADFCATTGKLPDRGPWTRSWWIWSKWARWALGIWVVGALLGSPALADDRVQVVGECHPPVAASVDGDWRKEALRFRETSLRALARYTDGEEGARRHFQGALQLAETTRVSLVEVVHISRELLIRGFRGKELDLCRGAVLDVRSALGGELSGRFMEIVGTIFSRGTLTLGDVNALEPIVAVALVKEAVARKLGLAGKGDPKELATVKLALGVSASAGLQAVYDAIARQYGATVPGEASRLSLSHCVAQMTKVCPRKQAEGHCQSTPREYLDLMHNEERQRPAKP